MNGAGIVHPQVLRNLGIDGDIYNGWAFGFGVDRLAMLKMKIPDIRLLYSKDERVLRQLKNINKIYEPVSKYPAIIRDISFVVDKGTFNLNAYYESVRETLGNDYVEEVKIIDEYEDDKKFGKNKKSHQTGASMLIFSLKPLKLIILVNFIDVCIPLKFMLISAKVSALRI